MTWKGSAAASLEVTTRTALGRKALRAATHRLPLPLGSIPFLHVDPVFTVSVDGGRFWYAGDDADQVARHLFWTGLRRWEIE